MADITYGVNVEYLSSGNLSLPGSGSGGIDKATSAFEGLKSAAQSFNGVLDSVIGGIVNFGVAAAEGIGVALAGGFSLALRESMKFNQEMEDTQTGLATLANAAQGLNGFSSSKESFGNQYRLAGDVIKEMRKDAQTLPGEFRDLQTIMQQVSPAADAAGMGMFETEKMSAAAMSAAAAMHLPFAQVGRQIGEIIEGNARVTNRTFLGLNMKDAKGNRLAAKDVNKMSQGDRLKSLEHALADQKPGLDSVSKNWSTISSNFVDNLKIGVGVVGGPLFDRVKDVMKEFNNSDKGGFLALGDKISRGLVKAFDVGLNAIKHWFPLIQTFLGTMARGIHRAFGGIGALFDILLPRLESFFQNPAAFAKIESLIGTLLALRAGGGALSAGASLVPMISSLGGGGAAGAALLSSIAAPLAIALGVAAIAVEGFTSALANPNSAQHENAKAEAKTFVAVTGRLGEEFTKLFGSVTSITEAFGTFAALIVNNVIGIFADLVMAVNLCIDGIRVQLNLIRGAQLNKENPVDGSASAERDAMMTARLDPHIVMDAFLEPAKAAAPPKHTTHIHKVEIKVMGEADPSRVARKTVGILQDLARNPRSSRLNPAAQFSTQ